MKRFLFVFSLALIILLLALTSTFTHTVLADSGNMADNVVYISDSAVEGGKGTSAEDPLYPTILPDEQLEPSPIEQTQLVYDENGNPKLDENGKKLTQIVPVTIYSRYKNTALYQAVEKLSETGGTVVICGEYEIDESEARQSNYWSVLEYHLPETKKTVTITSKYNGVDYAKTNGAKLTLTGYLFTILNGPTVWENMTIHSNLAPDRAICCNGNKTIFGEGLTCTKTEGTSSAYYLSVVGGKRYQATNTSVNVTIKSGTFYKFVGTTWTDPGIEYTCNCDVNLKLEGGNVYYIYGNSHNTVPNSVHEGNVDITITGGNVYSSIACTGSGGFKTESNMVNIKILGGNYLSNVKIMSRMNASSLEKGFESKDINVDLSGALDVTNNSLNKFVTNLPEGAEVIYPAKWITDNRTVKSTPAEKFVFVGDVPSIKGAVVNVEYQNPVTVGEKYNQTLEYTKDSAAFRVDCDTAKAGKATAKYYFGDWKFHEAEIDVIAVPEVSIKGVQIRVDTNKQQMYGWGEYTKGEYPDINIKECGVLALPSDLLITEEPFDHTNTYGMYDAKADKFSESDSQHSFGALVFGDEVIRENNYNRDYSLRAYIKFEYNGKEYYRYSNIIERCFYDVAQSAIYGDKETSEIKEWLKKNVVDVYNNYDETHCYNPEGSVAAREKVVQYMVDMKDVEWTPEKTFILYNQGLDNEYHLSGSTGSTAMYAIFVKGKTYHGIPYINGTMGQLEDFVDKIDWNSIEGNDIYADWNVNSISDLNKKLNALGKEEADALKKAGVKNAGNFPGNDCLASVIFAWNSILNNRDEIASMNSCNNIRGGKYGVIPVGEYDNSDYCNDCTEAMVKDRNGEQVMARAYAMLQPGDATIYSGNRNDTTGEINRYARHVRLVYEAPNVVYTKDEKGNKIIDLNNSTVRQIDQGGGGANRYIWRNENIEVLEPENKNTSSIQIITKTFYQLYDEGSLPVTVPELTTGNVDKPFAFVSKINPEEELPNGILRGTVSTNKQIIYTKAVFSQDGKTVREIKDILIPKGGNFHIAEYNLAGLDLSELSLTSGGNYTFDLYVCISGMDGEEIHLVDGYEFTAK